ILLFFFSSRRRHTRFKCDWSSDVCSSDLLVHVDVDDLGAVLDLVARHLQRRGVVAGGDQLAEFGRTRDVGALADIDERNLRRQRSEERRVGKEWRARGRRVDVMMNMTACM